jgi:LmbE family N-acetylglucosaminyl deacetylase
MVEGSLSGIKRVLCIGAHSDDIEIGCGGTIIRLVESNPKLEFYWVVFCSNATRAKEAKDSARSFLGRISRKTIDIRNFRDGFLPKHWAEVKECFEEFKAAFDPDVIFTHCRHDLHQDHRTLNELSWNTYRSHLILEYEIPKYDADLRSPNTFVALSSAQCRKKASLLMRHFGSQRNKQWFSEDLFMGLLRLRGIEAASPTRFAEGFYCRKILLGTR